MKIKIISKPNKYIGKIGFNGKKLFVTRWKEK